MSDTDFSRKPVRISARIAPVRESEVESYLVRQWEQLGGKAYKWCSPGRTSVPDRLLFHPRMWGGVVAVEVKAPGKKPTEKQAKVLLELERMGVLATFVDSTAAVDSLLLRLTLAHEIPGYRHDRVQTPRLPDAGAVVPPPAAVRDAGHGDGPRKDRRHRKPAG